MEIATYLAMTAEEFAAAPSAPEKAAWMACHFSPYSASLLNLPPHLPPNSLLILNDSTPPDRQDAKMIAHILQETLQKHSCSGLLLDFQRPGCPETEKMAEELVKLDCPVCVSECYAKDLECPVFLPPLPLTVPLSDYIQPWNGREIWLDTELSCQEITVAENGSTFRAVSADAECPLADKALHCHYRILIKDDRIIFTLKRTREDLKDLLSEAAALGITTTVGLYQELK